MRHTFSSQFLKISPPATNFGEAWELLCLELLHAESADHTVHRLAPPDRGVDIFRPTTGCAYQCKSNERGTFGVIDADDCVMSLKRAIDARTDIGWASYCIATNAPLTGIGIGKINGFADSAGIPRPSFLGPEYWDCLCEQHRSRIESFFDYRVFVTEAEVLEAMKKSRYYDHVIKQAQESMMSFPLTMRLTNNRTPIELQVPFSSELTVGKLVNVAQELLGISLNWANFPDLGTSCGPSVSLTVDRTPQAFKLKLSELNEEQRSKLQLWIKLIWRDELQKEREHVDGTKLYLMLEGAAPAVQGSLSPRDRATATLDRMEAIVQASIWRAIDHARPIRA